MAEVTVWFVKTEDLKETIQVHKDNGKRVLALSPSKILRGKVLEFVLVVQ